MPFWGVEVKPGNPYTHVQEFGNNSSLLRVTHAALGLGTGSTRSFLQCSVGSKDPVLLCSFFPDKSESCSLDLKFDEDDQVAFSVIGPRSIHLSGYYTGSGDFGDGELYSIGKDIEESESDESGSYESDDKYEEDFIDDGGLEMLPPSSRPNSGVVIKEILDEEVPAGGIVSQKSRKRCQGIDTIDENVHLEREIGAKQKQLKDSESEDEDGFPLSLSFSDKSCAKIPEGDGKSDMILDRNKQVKDKTLAHYGFESGNVQRSLISSVEMHTKSKKKKREHTQDDNDKMDGARNLPEKYEVDESDKSDSCDTKRRKKTKEKKNKKGEIAESVPDTSGGKSNGERDETSPDEKKDAANVDSATIIEGGRKKKKKKKKKSRNSQVCQDSDTHNEIAEEAGSKFQNKDDREVTISEPEKKQENKSSFGSTSEKESDLIEPVKHVKGQEDNSKPLQTRTFANGLMIEEMIMGEPEGKRASNGKKVSVYYIGKLQNGNIVDSNIGQRSFQFRLGVGQVIKGWDVGVNGMRIGDKRRLTVPPPMGYGSKNKGVIPANSWLVYDVELVDVK